jgi:CheY-like chemotaxis protein
MPVKRRLDSGRADVDLAGVADMSLSKRMQARIEAARVLIVDDDHYMRRVVRAMLYSIGVRHVHEAEDGMSGLEAICAHNPDVVIVDWEMPMIDGAQFVQMVRSPGEFPIPDVPIIMLTGHGDRWRVLEAARAGAHEYLLKPVSTKALHDRIVSVLSNPRPTVRVPGYYGPAPRNTLVFRDPLADCQDAFTSSAPAKPAGPSRQPPPLAAPNPVPRGPIPPSPLPASRTAPGRDAPAAPRPASPAVTRPAGPGAASPSFGRRVAVRPGPSAAQGQDEAAGSKGDVVFLN